MIFAALPPETISGWMYTGPGAGPMLAAAGGWNGLGSELTSTALAYQSVVTALTAEEWLGPTSMAMATAIAPYVTWMYRTAEAAEHAGAQAMASAAAFESAFAMTVPPPVIVANRAQLAALVATNILGQNSAAIAATEAHYAEMWAQDSAAMNGYAGLAAAAAQLQPLTPPTGPHGAVGGVGAAGAAPASQAGLSQLVTNLPQAMQQLSTTFAGSTGSPAPTNMLSDLFQNFGVSDGTQALTAAAGNIGAWHLFAGIASGIGAEQAEEAGVLPIVASGATWVDATEAADALQPASASLGEAYEVDGLSVPPSWSTAVPAEPEAVTLADAATPAATASGFSIPGGGYGLAAAGGAMAPLAMRARQPGATAAPSKSLLARSRARKRRAARRRAQPTSDD